MATAGTSYNVAPNPNDSFSSILPIGSMLLWSTSTAPSGFLLCDGSAVNRQTFAPLFAVIGTTWGAGDGSTTFNVPNTAGRVVRGVNGTYTQALTGGAESVTLVAENLPNHSHTTKVFPHSHSITDPGHAHQQQQPGGLLAAPGASIRAGDDNTGGPSTFGALTGITATNSELVGVITQDSVLVQTGGPLLPGTQITQVPTTLVNTFVAINHIIKAQ